MNIGLISDTHGLYSELWKEHFEKCDVLFHMGDFDSQACYDWFTNLGIPLYAVRGNCDRGPLTAFLPQSMNVPINGKLFHLVHNRAFLPLDLDEVDYVIFGHTHIPCDEKKGHIRFINPGTAGNDRGAGLSMAILHLDENSEKLERIVL